MTKKYTVFVGSIMFGMIIGAAIFYFFINTEEVLSSGLDDKNIEKNLKPDEVDMLSNNDYKQLLIGMWSASTDTGNAYNDLYSFSVDGTFILKYSQLAGEKRMIEISGYWEIIHHDLLALTINKKNIMEGGELTQNVISTLTPEEIIYPLKDLENNEIKNSLMLKIGGKQYCKLRDQSKDNEIDVSARGSQ